jgi:uncharacterized membrane protein YphA (DoxX/SURF4 family)
MEPFNFESILEQVHILGIAMFLFITGRGAVSIDRVFRQQKALPVPEAPAIALTLLRVCMGIGIAFGALTEKLLDPGLAGALLAERPYLNVAAGLGVSNGQFAFLAGLVELVIGLVIVSGQLTRPVMAAGAVLFTATSRFRLARATWSSAVLRDHAHLVHRTERGSGPGAANSCAKARPHDALGRPELLTRCG